MKKGLTLSAVICLLGSLYASGWDDPLPSEHRVGRLELPSAPAEIDSFGTYVYVASVMTVFSYESNNLCKVYDKTGDIVWSGTLKKDKYVVVDCPDSSVCWVSATKGISVLNGDPFVPSGMGSWFAMDPYNNPLSTKLLSIGPGVKPSLYDEVCFVVFSYQDSTYVTLKKIQGDSLIWEGMLDSAAIYRWDTQGKNLAAVSVEASKPVSAMTGTFGVAFSPPSFNGTFTGRDFMSYAHYETYPQDLQIVPWEDSTSVTITELGNPSNVIWEAFCEKKGEIKGTQINDNQYNLGGPRKLFIHSDKDISIFQTPWVSFEEPNPFYLAKGITREGSGLGSEYYIPLLKSFEEVDPEGFYPSRLYVLSFKDNNSVQVRRIPKDGGNDTLIWQGSVNKGECYEYTCPAGLQGDRAIYHVIASDTVVTLGGYIGSTSFADFFPMLHWDKPIAVGEGPATVTRLEVVNPVCSQITLRYSNCPGGIHASVYDASGRKADELHSSRTQGTLEWGGGERPGVYFIKVNSDGSTLKVILIK